MRAVIVLLSALSLGVACRADTKPAASAEPAKQTTHDIDRASMDTSVAPGDDLFRYANGSWLKTVAIPPDRGVAPECSERALG